MKRFIKTTGWLAMAAAIIFGTAACSSSDDSIAEQQPVNPTEPKTYTMTIQATKGNDATTRALSLSGTSLIATWKKNETVDVYKVTVEAGNNVYTSVGTLTAQADGETATLSGNLTGTFEKNDNLALFFHGGVLDYRDQTGTLDNIASKYDYATAYTEVSEVDGSNITVVDAGTKDETIPFDNQQAIVKFTLKDKTTGDPISMKSLRLHDENGKIFDISDFLNESDHMGDIVVTRSTAGSEFYVAIKTEEDYVEPNLVPSSLNLTLTATDDTDIYTYTKSGVQFECGKYYEITVKMQKSAPAAAEAVDLGLSSGTKWANMNVGATSESDYGLFFAWGETTGYAGSHDFGWTNYKWSAGSKDGTQFSKYVLSSESNYWGGEGSADNKTKLDLEDDAAHANWGGSWRMPTYAEVNELLATETDANYTWTWTSVDGHNGYRITNKSTSATIFLPAAGYWDGTSLTEQGNRGLYWTSSLFDSPRGLILYFSNMTTPGSDWHPRSYGFTVRPVCP